MRRSTEAKLVLKINLSKDNYSHSSKGVLRGLHFQKTKPQGKLARVAEREVFDVAVDMNPTSPTFKQWVCVTVSGNNHTQFYVLPGYAHGFLVLSDSAGFQYKCTEFYYPEDDAGIIWNGSEISINGPMDIPPLVSDKDAKLPTIAEYTKNT